MSGAGANDNTTSAPTMSPTTTATLAPNACQELEPGDVVIFLVNSDDPDLVALFALEDITKDVGSLYLTDNAWTGSELATNEGTLELELPDNGLLAGLIFGFGDNVCLGQNWTAPSDRGDTPFDLSSIRGDQVLVYCLGSAGQPHFLWGFNYEGGPWAEPSNTTAAFETNSSALPETLDAANAYVSLPHCDNYIYEVPANARQFPNKTETLRRFADPANYKCDNSINLLLDEVYAECVVPDSWAVATSPGSAFSWLVTVGMVWLTNSWWK